MIYTKSENSGSKNPRRVAAGRLNRLKRKGLTDEGREKLRMAALTHQPWQHSTGPRTDDGKAISANNGRSRQTHEVSIRQIRDQIVEVDRIIQSMREMRLSLM